MSFSSFMTDNIVVRKQNGEIIEDIKASVSHKGIFLNRSDILIEALDIIERRMTNGAIESFEVIDPGFHEKFGGIEAHYQMRVRKLGIPEAEKIVSQITYNISGPNARVNHQSIDNSTNHANSGIEQKELLDGIRHIIQEMKDENQKKEAMEIIEAVEIQIESSKPSKAVVTTLLNALPHIASITQITAAIIASL
ncbi:MULTISPECIES: hypothetical protein [unclassified Pseudomonas]|uniref:hypothetical protein n=1 Tax=unclassified Pseudomonas TaxID=196821 RepID=UPI00244CD1BD|nr:MULTISPECIES: hypothetical protein [unclassified Pseudomonas]MDH0894430.1 hypothetical protein [Pseudomonas sp. GD03875]MDH1063275.1 hypothetical protein [Pseudomonas sp. GD03985]